MSADAIWSAFAETGEPAVYLLYRAAEEERRKSIAKVPKNGPQGI